MDARLDTRVSGRPDHRRAVHRGAAPVPAAPTPFAPEATTFATVTPRALIRLEGAVYSVWTRWAGLDVVVRVGATTVTIVGRDGTRVTIRGNALGSGRSTTGITCRSSRASPKRCARCCRSSCGISAPVSGDLGSAHGAHGPREAARLFAKVLGQLETHGAAVVVPALTRALATGTPCCSRSRRRAAAAVAPDAVPAPLRDIAVASGCAADYDGWLLGGAA
jgi:hypothetical protein